MTKTAQTAQTVIDSSSPMIRYTKVYNRVCPACNSKFSCNHPKKRYCREECNQKITKEKQAKFREKYRKHRKEQEEIADQLGLTVTDRWLLLHPPGNDIFENRINFLKFLKKVAPGSLDGLYKYLKS